MISNFEKIKNHYYSNFDVNNMIQEIKKEIDSEIMFVKKEFIDVFEKMMKKEPCLYWNKDVFIQTRDKLEAFYEDMQGTVELSDIAIDNFIMGYNSYCQLTETILDLKNFNLSVELKTRLYRLPTYTALVESCMSNFLNTIATFLEKALDKNYSKQQKLGPLLDIMKSNGFTEIEKNVDVNIRNAINHGKFKFQKTPQDKICFFYMERGISQAKEITISEFDRIIDCTYDTVSAVLLALVVFMNRHLDISSDEYSKGNYQAFSILAMGISLPGIVCQNISDVRDAKQINVDMIVENTEQAYLAMLSVEISIIIFSIYHDYNQYMINFQNPRLGMCWARYKREDLMSVLEDINNMPLIYEQAINNKEFTYYKADNDDVDLNEIKYFCFPNYESINVKVNQVKDISIDERKRLKADVFVKNDSSKSDILKAIDEAINWLKYVKNPPCAKFPHKYGDMEADALYVNVYRNDTRGNKELLPDNHNFICFVDYNLNGETTLLHGGLPLVVWKKFYHEVMKKYRIAWREQKYAVRTVKKIEVNAPCPCGSGKKFKKCCKGKGIYD